MDRNEGEGEEGNDLPLPALESLDDYVRRYGLLSAAGGDDPPSGEYNGLNCDEAKEQVRAEEAYCDEVIAKHHGMSHEQRLHDAASQHQIEESEGLVSLLLANKSTYTMPVQPLVAFCDTAQRMIDSREHYGIVEDGKASNTSPNLEMGGTEDCPIMKISLVEFDADATTEFIGVLMVLWDHRLKWIIPGIVPQKRNRNDEMKEIISNVCNKALINDGTIPEQHIVECLRLAHYLQCHVVLDTLTSIVKSSIDAHNCMAICSLADSLNLSSLFEASVNYVIERLDAVQGTADGKVNMETLSSVSKGDNDIAEPVVWASLPYELRSRIMTMRNVMRSSVIGRGSKVSGLFFSSGAEFLAIFRETIRDQNERLKEAKERSQEVIRERLDQWQGHGVLNCRDVAYCLEKIETQSRRLKTLEKFYEEQKTIFEGSSFASGILL